MRPLRHFAPVVFLATAPLGFALGGGWAFLSLGALPIGLAGLDWIGGDSPPDAGAREALVYRLCAWLYIPLQLALTLCAAAWIRQPGVSLAQAVGLTVSVGLTAGVFGMVAAHEMIHSRRAGERALGLSFLASVGYMHFSITHLHGHHVRAATPDDPASARRGESAYGFVARSILGQLSEAWAFESERLRRRGLAVFGLANRMVLFAGVEVAALALAAAFGWKVLAFFVAQGALAVLLLELFNYIAHYGLVRRALPSGRWERLEAHHSWNTAKRMSNWSLFNMGRHSDHHRRPTRSYQGLEGLDQSPELPSGYAGAILLALVPPLWRRVMDPKVDAWREIAETAGAGVQENTEAKAPSAPAGCP